MNYYSEKDIRDIIYQVLTQSGHAEKHTACETQEVPVEISARHVHLTEAAIEKLFGKGQTLTPKRPLSQPGQFLSEQRVKLVTPRGELTNIAVLGPARPYIQVELSLTDSKVLGVKPPIRLSGDLSDAGDVLIVGPNGCIEAKEAVIVAQAHVHMLPEDAEKYHVKDGEKLSVRLDTARPVTLENVIVRVTKTSKLAVHIDFDEANAAQVSGDIKAYIVKKCGG